MSQESNVLFLDGDQEFETDEEYLFTVIKKIIQFCKNLQLSEISLSR